MTGLLVCLGMPQIEIQVTMTLIPALLPFSQLLPGVSSPLLRAACFVSSLSPSGSLQT